MQGLFAELALRDRTLVMLDVPTGMRRGELLAIQWRDVDFQKWTLNIRKSIWQQHLGPVKTEESEKTVPLDEEMIADLVRWRAETPYAQDDDWIFASPRMLGRPPLWPEALMRNYIAPAGKRAGITKHINWHVFRHTFSTLLAENDEDVKTVQSLAPCQQQHHHERLYPCCKQQEAPGPKQSGGDDFAASQEGPSSLSRRGYGLMCTFLCTTPIWGFRCKPFKRIGGDDGTRTRGLCRDRAAF